MLRRPFVSLERPNTKSAATLGAGDPTTSTPRVPSPEEAEEVVRRAKLYVLIDGDLHRRRDNGVKLRCIPREQGQSLLQDIHGGTCSSHVASRSLAGKVFRQGFYWPTVLQDAEQIVKTCEACQYYARNINQPAQALQPIPISWPFTVKWVEVMPVPRQTA